MHILVYGLIQLLDIYLWIVILTVMASWLLAFGVLNAQNKWVYKGWRFLDSLTAPALRFLRRYVPAIGGIDITPMVLIFGIYIVQALLFGML